MQSNSMCKSMLEGGNLAVSAGCVDGTDTLEGRPLGRAANQAQLK